MRGLAGRVGTPLPVGNEGAGTVVAAGESPAARALLGKTVAAAGGGMYSQYRSVNVALCLELPAGATAIDGAASFVNPMTVLGMVDTMRTEDHRALVHTAAASNLGQMLNRVCIEQQIPLVNIVRKRTRKRCSARPVPCTSAIRRPTASWPSWPARSRQPAPRWPSTPSAAA